MASFPKRIVMNLISLQTFCLAAPGFFFVFFLLFIFFYCDVCTQQNCCWSPRIYSSRCMWGFKGDTSILKMWYLKRGVGKNGRGVAVLWGFGYFLFYPCVSFLTSHFLFSSFRSTWFVSLFPTLCIQICVFLLILEFSSFCFFGPGLGVLGCTSLEWFSFLDCSHRDIEIWPQSALKYHLATELYS